MSLIYDENSAQRIISQMTMENSALKMAMKDLIEVMTPIIDDMSDIEMATRANNVIVSVEKILDYGIT